MKPPGTTGEAIYLHRPYPVPVPASVKRGPALIFESSALAWQNNQWNLWLLNA